MTLNKEELINKLSTKKGWQIVGGTKNKLYKNNKEIIVNNRSIECFAKNGFLLSRYSIESEDRMLFFFFRINLNHK